MSGENPDPEKFDPRRVPPNGRFRRPRLYLVGEAPGAEEANKGKPFVGPAGETLHALLDEAGIDRTELRFANAVPFRPVTRSADGGLRNRTPSAHEIDRFGAPVLTDIRRSKPRAIVALGTAAAHLFGETRPLRDARRRPHDFEGCPLRITYHPAYVRRFGGPGSDAWRRTVADLRQAWLVAA